jgi:hypothetical protein
MFDIQDILWLTGLALLAFYGLGAHRVKQRAQKLAIAHCAEMQVQFLDQSVYLKRWGCKRNDSGQLSLSREYCFEFTVSGDDRYIGRVTLLGNKIITIQLDPHRFH